MRMPMIVLLSVVMLMAGCATPSVSNRPAPAAPALIPAPMQLQAREGQFVLRDGAVLAVHSTDASARVTAQGFSDRLAATRGLRVRVDSAATAAAIVFVLDPQADAPAVDEGYRLDIRAQGIELAARTPAGLFRGATTLWQLLTAQTTPATAIELASLHIVDAPRFRWRGVLLDSARHYQQPAFVKKFIDEIALLKFNTLHWHLTDDQGWRIQIKRYPRLTEVGAWRTPAGAASADARGRPVREGGFYTQEEIADIVRHAAERQVMIVPEIDMPGHMQAAIAAYPELGSAGDTPAVSHDWGVHPYLLNVDEATFDFIDNVLDEVMALFPAPYIHIGGDEALKDQWKASPRVQARMRELGLRDENALQGWFVARVRQHLAQHGRRMVGWDEILDAEVPADAVVMSWRGSAGGVRAAQAGHDVVMSPSPDLYFDHLQSDAPDEPSGRPDVRSLADIHAYEPEPAAFDAGARAHLLGAQANLWTEHMRTPALVEHAAFPRLAALAEVLWSPRSARDWKDFLARLPAQYARWRADGVAAADSAFEVRATLARSATAGRYTVSLANAAATAIRYRLDGGEPDAASPQYHAPLSLVAGTPLRAAAFVGTQRIAASRAIPISDQELLEKRSAELHQCAGKLTLRLAGPVSGGVRARYYTVDLFDPCWQWLAAPLDGVHSIEVDAARLPFNFQLAHDVGNIVPRPVPETANGELIVHRDGCDGARIASMPLPAAVAADGGVRLRADLPELRGAHALCLRFSGRGPDPLWAIDRVRLIRR